MENFVLVKMTQKDYEMMVRIVRQYEDQREKKKQQYRSSKSDVNCHKCQRTYPIEFHVLETYQTDS